MTLSSQQVVYLYGTPGQFRDKIEQVDGGIKVYTAETVCSSGEPQGSDRNCTYALGVVWGALEQFLGKRLKGKDIESVLRGASHDIFMFIDMPK